MKSIGGVPATKPGQSLPLIFERPGQDPIVFKAEPVWDWDEFDKLWPAPDPSPYQRMVLGGWEIDHDAPAYRDLLKQRRAARWNYTIIKSLAPSEIEWTKVNLDQPQTWKHAEDELGEFLCVTEFNLVIAYIQDANYMSASKLEGNRERFFQAQAKRLPTTNPPTSPTGGPACTSSSAPARDSVSVPPV